MYVCVYVFTVACIVLRGFGYSQWALYEQILIKARNHKKEKLKIKTENERRAFGK